MVVRNDTERFRGVIGAQGRNRTTDTGIFSPFKFLGKNAFLSGDVRQAPAKTRQGRYAEARSCTVGHDLAQQKPRMVSTRRRKPTGFRRIASAPSASTREVTVPAVTISVGMARNAGSRCCSARNW